MYRFFRLLAFVIALTVAWQIFRHRDHNHQVVDTVDFYKRVHEREIGDGDTLDNVVFGDNTVLEREEDIATVSLDQTNDIDNDDIPRKVLLWHSGTDRYGNSDNYKDADDDKDSEYSSDSQFVPNSCEDISCEFTTDRNEFSSAGVVVFHALKANNSDVPTKAFDGQIYMFYLFESSPKMSEQIKIGSESLLFNMVYTYHTNASRGVRETITEFLDVKQTYPADRLLEMFTPDVCHFRCIQHKEEDIRDTLFESICLPHNAANNKPTFPAMRVDEHFQMECSVQM